jgi:hypothetical protein
MTMSKSKNPNSNSHGKHKPATPIAKSESAGTTNRVDNSLIKCEVNLEKGEWVSPDSCAIFHIDSECKFPEIAYEIKTDEDGPYDWSWELKWNVLACPLRRDKARFKPKRAKTFIERGNFASDSKKWNANLNDQVIGGELTVKVRAGSSTFIRKTLIRGEEAGEGKVLEELLLYAPKYPKEVDLAKKIFKQESKFCHFYSDGQPLASFDNGYGLGQATDPMPSFEQAWNWKKHVNFIVTVVIPEKRKAAKRYLNKHGNYTDENLDMETFVFYNGANHHYLVWDESAKKWIENEDVLCDPNQSNAGWDMTLAVNNSKSLEQLRHGDGDKPIYTGGCYAKHISKQPGEK